MGITTFRGSRYTVKGTWKEGEGAKPTQVALHRGRRAAARIGLLFCYFAVNVDWLPELMERSAGGREGTS
jgi:hypothetical protein